MTSLAPRSSLRAPSRWWHQLALVALNPEGPGALGDLTRVLGQAAGAEAAVLWEAQPGGCTPALMLSRWLDGPVPPDSGCPVPPDPVTDHAFQIRSLALPADLSGDPATLFGLPVAAALPVDYVDGAAGALTLLGADELSAGAFDVAAELVEILPELRATLRERQTLALVQACNTILHDADVEAPEQPLHRERLRAHLEHVCHLVAQRLECTDVAIFLQDTPAAGDRYPLFARCGQPGQECPSSRESTSAAEGAPPRAQVDGALMELPLRSGNQVWGLIRCTRAGGSSLHFTNSDLPLLHPVAAAVAQYWRSWLHRRTISAENDSWRQLAAGISDLNRLLARELRGNAAWDPRREQRVCEAALRIVQDVVPESTWLVVSRTERTSSSAGRLVPVSSVGAGQQASPAGPGAALAEQVFHTRRQSWVTDPDELARVGAGPDAGWLLCTPVGVGDRVYGVLQATGPTGELPANSAQACEIVADQLGLYRHLQQAQLVLQTSMRSQAETMEDLKHQLASPLRTATDRTDLVLRSGRFDTRAEAQLKAVRGLCRKASRVALSAGVFAALSRGKQPTAKTELIGVDDLMRLLIAGADDAQVLSNPMLGILFDVDRDAVRRLGRRLVDVDTSFLQQCLGNVLDNAGKYGYPNTRVRIGATVIGGQLAIEVTSTGIPLDAKDAARCLQRNWRGELARNTTGEGSGIGLWIVDHLIRSMNGTVQLCPAADTTTVRLVLPLA
ncbi:MAG TPA: sensor histidine kinase [Pseudonocardiaceae bacterium]|jgi:signal transduction histidine kinase|nr:sensor histidine kinase [Pseudonocardiaceae bacterium]